MIMLDILIRNAQIADGSGNPIFTGNIGIEADKIAFVNHGESAPEAGNVVDATGLLCTPGFIDAHSHADISLPYYPDLYNLLCQGITTFAGGNCGIGLAPALDPAFYRPYFAALDVADLDICWQSFDQWLDYVRTLKLGANYVPLVGLNPIRGGILGPDYARPSTDEEIRRELAALTEALDAGAFGLSLSLDPGVAGHFADARELNAMCEILQAREVLFTAHTRHHQTQWPSEDGKSYYGWFIGEKGEAICGRYQGLVEFMEYYRRFPKLRCMIAHLTNAYGIPQPHSKALEHAMLDETVEFLVNEPVRDGCDVYYNDIPDDQSISSSYRVATMMLRNMPYDQTVHDYATEDKMIAGLRDPDFRRKMHAFINGGKFKLTMLHPATDPYWANDYQITASTIPGITGKTLMQITKERMPGTDRELVYHNCVEVLFDLLLEDPYLRGAMCLDKREYETTWLLRNQRSMPITDTVALPKTPDTSRNIMGYGTPPVAYNIFVRYLLRMCREYSYLSIPEAVHRITQLPAKVLRIKKRGVLQAGCYADLTLLDWDKLSYQNDFEHPAQPPQGICHVLVNGRFAVRSGEVLQSGAGRVLNRLHP